MNQLLLFSCLLIISTVAGAPSGADDQKTVPVKPFQAQDCNLPIEDDTEFSCRALMPRYMWSVKEKKCVGEFYGGCHATINNFKTKKECQEIAEPVCSKI
ncbi:PI-actitoxin-Axm2a-like [Diorhabda sublineata]|uniref:PI-actitoxin-Axm2a-like n=1 Tax=Diorhabda sublineata TaxID=1163346 RepID=UPI0024E184D0|nr:PI-actitoxin-Axm2a-like [Diorhabda sublineata]